MCDKESPNIPILEITEEEMVFINEVFEFIKSIFTNLKFSICDVSIKKVECKECICYHTNPNSYCVEFSSIKKECPNIVKFKFCKNVGLVEFYNMNDQLMCVLNMITAKAVKT